MINDSYDIDVGTLSRCDIQNDDCFNNCVNIYPALILGIKLCGPLCYQLISHFPIKMQLWNCFRIKNVCGHSVAVAQLEQRLPELCSKVCANPRNKAKDPNSSIGRKPTQNRIKRKYVTLDDEDDQTTYFTGPQHNNENFTVVPVSDIENVSSVHKFKQACYSCNLSFPIGAYKKSPQDIILEHPEKWVYLGEISRNFTKRYYCISKKCILKRFGSTFTTRLLNGNKINIKEGLELDRAHKAILRKELGMRLM